MKKEFYELMLAIIVMLTQLGCQKLNTKSAAVESVKATSTLTTTTTTTIIKGFNQNYSQFPDFTNTVMLQNVRLLKPAMIRYPGGTLGNNWSWQDGRVLPAVNWHPVHPLTDLITLKNATGAKTIFMLNMVTRTVEDQIKMLDSAKRLGIAIEYVELGNELYANGEGYEIKYPTGSVYADTVRRWVPKIKAAFPTVKIASLLFGRSVLSSNTRMYNWNIQVVSGTSSVVDAFTYHVYIADGNSFQARKLEFERVRAATPTGTKPLWFTEYGNMNLNTNSNYLAQLDSLAKYIETYPRVSVSLNHQIIAPAKFNKLTEDGLSFTPEGQMYLQRVN